MALTSQNDQRETYRESYNGVFRFLYAIRRYIHFYVVALAIFVMVAPSVWWLWLPCYLFLANLDGDSSIRIQDRFGRGLGPYVKKKAGKKYGLIEEWSVISTPKHRGGDGIWPLGNNIFTQEEVWCSDDYVRAHAVLSGTTGSGKTVSMSSTFIYVALVSNSGVIMIDGKADPKTWFELFSQAVAADRADDFLVLNFVVGATQEAEFAFTSAAEKELWEEFQAIESNTFNIFGTGSADTLFEIGSGLLGDDASGDNKMWVERAQALLRSLLKALADLRDKGQLKISIATLQQYMSLEKLSELEKNEDISKIARQQVGAVLNEIAGYRDAMKIEDPQRRAMALADQPSKQFAFLHMQFGALYAMLIGTYGHICNVEYSDIYTPDVIRNRRILLVMLPALEKAPTSLAQLGRMATSAIKSALSQNISGSLTGRYSELVARRPTNSLRAMLLIYDEAASYIQAGTADVASQSRSLGAFNIFSSQEWSSFKQAGEIEATRLISNSGLKIVLKNEDKETADHFMNAVGEATVLKAAGKKFEKGSQIETERRYENVPRVTFQEMQNLAEGQAFVKWRDTMIQIRMPFVNVPMVESAQRNDLVPLPGSMPNDRVKMRREKALANDASESRLPPLNLVDALVECSEEDQDPEMQRMYPLFEQITRILYKKQAVIPWQASKPPPRGKVTLTRLYKFSAESMAEDLMWALEKSTNEVLAPLKTMPNEPETRFIIPFLPHEEGLVDPAFLSQASIIQTGEEIDQEHELNEKSIQEHLQKRKKILNQDHGSVEGDGHQSISQHTVSNDDDNDNIEDELDNDPEDLESFLKEESINDSDLEDSLAELTNIGEAMGDSEVNYASFMDHFDETLELGNEPNKGNEVDEETDKVYEDPDSDEVIINDDDIDTPLSRYNGEDESTDSGDNPPALRDSPSAADLLERPPFSSHEAIEEPPKPDGKIGQQAKPDQSILAALKTQGYKTQAFESLDLAELLSEDQDISERDEDNDYSDESSIGDTDKRLKQKSSPEEKTDHQEPLDSENRDQFTDVRNAELKEHAQRGPEAQELYTAEDSPGEIPRKVSLFNRPSLKKVVLNPRAKPSTKPEDDTEA